MPNDAPYPLDRNRVQRLFCVVPQTAYIESDPQAPPFRRDMDTHTLAVRLMEMVKSGETLGSISAVLRTDGRIEFTATGAAVASPLIAKGMAAELAALIDGHREHPGVYLPED